ncbi:peptidoglycan-binding protein [Bradyrhizobium sp. CCBAU 53338]|uniref:peptidoglycan-binding domain-containing protein n=1 Tax=Bradyrhizobium sp. CCBAU 53338 TaxID=1325111 RepID=UPI00188A315B|nr:peptidoglycan-binding domain-containing protein [Bradyrhizobium sp. CCBAU 53338]QOZ51607.1 hypothetical protein XH90_09580 [Bradyrhizobium sp. CCBAU 53338]
MSFLLARGAKNVPAEVQRWQYFLLRKGFNQTGGIDAEFGEKTEKATKFFQVAQELKPTGALDARTLEVAAMMGYTVPPDDYYAKRSKASWPSKPEGTASPTNRWRNEQFGCFKFKQLARPYRADAESIVILGSCDGAYSDWIKQNIIDIEVNQLEFAKGYPGYVRCHRLAAAHIASLFSAWEKADLLHLGQYQY